MGKRIHTLAAQQAPGPSEASDFRFVAASVSLQSAW